MPFEIIRNDITKMKVDAIVNAANCSLLGGGGVDGAIHHAAGPELLAECRTLGGCETGQAKITKGYRLPAKYVIHTVGPIWHGGKRGEKELLTACYRNSLELALRYECETVAFPMISAGAYGYPKDQAMAVAVDVITDFLLRHDMMVWLVVFGHTEFLNGKKLFRDVQEYIDDVYVSSHLKPNAAESRRKLWQRNEKEALRRDQEYAASLSEACNQDYDEMMSPSASVEDYDGMIRPSASRPDWEALLKKTDEGFSESLLRLIDQKGMSDSECYKKANVDRKLFSKIRSNPAYRPSKPTVLAFAVSLQLTLPETKDLLKKAGFALSHSNKQDIVLEYFIRKRMFNIHEINEVLFELDLPLLGTGCS